MSQYPVQNQPTTLSGAGVAIGATTIVLSSFKKIDGTNLAMSDFGDIGYATVEPGSASKEEQISFSGLTQNADGTCTLSGVKTVLMTTPWTETSGFAQSHAGGTNFVISNTSGFYKNFAGLANPSTWTATQTFSVSPIVPTTPATNTSAINQAYATATFVGLTGDQTVAGVKTFSSKPQVPTGLSSDLSSAASIEYVNNTATSGAPNASTTVKGIVEEATAAEVVAGTATGGTGARLFVNPTACATYGADKVLLTDSTGKISSAVIPGLKFGGDGSDGALSITTGTTTINLASADCVVKNYTSISITGGGRLAFSNPNDAGTVVILKSQGDVTLAGTTNVIGLANCGALAATNGTSWITPTNKGGAAGAYTTNTPGAGGNGLGYLFNLYSKSSKFSCGAGGATGGGGEDGTPGSGGRGGGALYIECAGNLNFTATNGISVAGSNGVDGTALQNFAGAGGGGGGAGGTCLIVYNNATATYGTVGIAPGNGGAGGVNSGSAARIGGNGGGGGGNIGSGLAGTAHYGSNNTNGGNGGQGATGSYLLAKNTEYL